MKTRKILSVLLAVTMLIGLMPAFTVSLAAGADNLRFWLNEDGESYSVLFCSEGASGELVIPETYNGKSVTGIDDCAFGSCTSLTSIIIPDTVTGIGASAFEGCTGLTSITIPDSVTSIGSGAFCRCTRLTLFDVSAGNAEYSSSDGVLFDKEKTLLIQYPADKNQTSYFIPDSVTSIGGSAFEGCTILTSVTIGNSVTSVGGGAFGDCTSLTSITIGNSVASVGDWTFYGCTGLTSVTIPDSVTSIGESALQFCTSLTSITIPDSVTSIGDRGFAG